MIAISEESGCWPTRRQELILRSALLRGEEALQAWNEWKKCAGIDAVDLGSHHIIPQLYKNLVDHSVADPLMDELLAVCRHYGEKNNVLFQKASRVIKAFHDEGVASIVLKGAALVPLYYKEMGLRPMNDIDILVRTKQVPAAMAILKKLGWKPMCRHSPETCIAIRHSIPFVDKDGEQIDLHWHFLWECRHANDSEYWDSAIPITINDVPTLALSPTYQLLHTCWHGARWNEVPPIRWIADAMVILNDSRTEINWTLFINQAERHRIALPLEQSLECLQNVVKAQVPSYVIESLHHLPISRIERLSRDLEINPLAHRSTPKILMLLYHDYVWLASSTTAQFKTLAFARFIQHKWNIKYFPLVPLVLCGRALRRSFRDIW